MQISYIIIYKNTIACLPKRVRWNNCFYKELSFGMIMAVRQKNIPLFPSLDKNVMVTP